MQSAVEAGVKHPVTIEEAWSELERELQVRHRLFDKWVTEQKISWADARDRYARLRKACAELKKLVELRSGDTAEFQPQVVNA